VFGYRKSVSASEYGDEMIAINNKILS